MKVEQVDTDDDFNRTRYCCSTGNDGARVAKSSYRAYEIKSCVSSNQGGSNSVMSLPWPCPRAAVLLHSKGTKLFTKKIIAYLCIKIKEKCLHSVLYMADTTLPGVRGKLYTVITRYIQIAKKSQSQDHVWNMRLFSLFVCVCVDISWLGLSGPLKNILFVNNFQYGLHANSEIRRSK